MTVYRAVDCRWSHADKVVSRRQEGDKTDCRGSETGLADAVVARAPFIDAQAPRGRGPRERNAAAASNDRVRVASFTRSAGRRTTADASPPRPPPPTSPFPLHTEPLSTRPVLHGVAPAAAVRRRALFDPQSVRKIKCAAFRDHSDLSIAPRESTLSVPL
ncbi:unnamed protein product, partial [Iphiclides podalirius]